MASPKWLWPVLIGIVALLGIFYGGRNVIFSNLAQDWIEKNLALAATVEKAKIGYLLNDIKLENLALMDSPDRRETLAVIESFYGSGAPVTLMRGALNFKTAELRIDRIELIRKKHEKQAHLKGISPASPGNLKIGMLTLAIAKVKYIDYTPQKPLVRVISLNGSEETYRDLHDLRQLLKIVETQAIVKADLNPTLARTIANKNEAFQKNVKQASRKVKRFFKDLFKKTE